MNENDVVTAYCLDLRRRLRGSLRRIDDVVEEIEQHLRQSVADAVAGGATAAAAAEAAVRRMGAAILVATLTNRETARLHRRSAAAALAVASPRLALVGAIAIAASAALSATMAIFFSPSFVFGLPAGIPTSGADCDRWLSAQPSASNCVAAALAENAADGVAFRLVAAIAIAMLAMIATPLLTRWRRQDTGLASTVEYALGSIVFGIAATVLTLASVINLYQAGLWGRGLWLAQGAVSAIIAILTSLA